MRRNRFRPVLFAAAVILLSFAAWMRLSAEPSPAVALTDVWQRVHAAGAYSFRADVTQREIPLATIANVGRTSRTSAFYMEGTSHTRDEQVELTLWSGAGSVLDAGSGISIQIDGDAVRAREGDSGEWQPLEGFGGLFAPNGDFTAFLTAAKDVTVHPGPDGQVRYTFAVDGGRYAAYMREQLRAEAQAAGELLPGMTVQVPGYFAQMTGEGTVWVGADGLPLRQELALQFPEEASPQAGSRLEVASTITFSDFAPPAIGFSFGTVATSVAEGVAAAAPVALLLTATVGLLFVMARYRRGRYVYRAISVLFIFTMVTSPLLQGVQASTVSRRQAARRAAAQAREDEAASRRALQDAYRPTQLSADDHLSALRHDDGRDRDGDGYSDVVETVVGTQVTAVDDEISELYINDACVALIADGYTTADADADGLTDYEECVLGTSSDTTTYRDGVTYDGVDTDGDELPDLWEVTGYTYAGQAWFTDPLEVDTNRDGIHDALEWLIDSDDDGAADDGDNDGIPDMRDTDSDNVPDLFDLDNDGDGVPDRYDTSPFTASAVQQLGPDGALTGFTGQTFGETTPLELQLDNLDAGVISFVEIQLRPTDPDHLWYALNVFDWPENDTRGQMQDTDGLTFLDVATDDQSAANDGYGDTKLIPMLEIRIPGDNPGLPDESVLADYGISVHEDVDGVLVYVPLYVVVDEFSGAHVAFQARMLYLPGAGWDAAHEVKFIWMVQALVDRCDSYEVDDGDDSYQSEDCQSYEALNEIEVIHVYDNDDWYLTGLSVREDHGVEYATVYEDPTVDSDISEDGPLSFLAQGLDFAFVGARDADGDGDRDITVDTIYDRWNRTTNGGATLEERWKLPDIFGVVRTSYENIDVALGTIAVTDTLALLDNAFGAPPTQPITPTLLFAREETYRTAGLDAAGDVASWSNARLTIDMDPALVSLDLLAGLNWAPYTYADGTWVSVDLEDYYDELAFRYEDSFPDDDADVAEGKLIGVQLYYTGLYRGISRIVEVDDIVSSVAFSLDYEDKEIIDTFFGALGVGGIALDLLVSGFIVKNATSQEKTSFWKYLKNVFGGGSGKGLKGTLEGGWKTYQKQVQKITRLNPWLQQGKIKFAAGAILGVTLILITTAIVLLYVLGGSKAGAIAVGIVAGVIVFALTVVGAIVETISAIKGALKGTQGVVAGVKAVSKALVGLNELAQASKIANIAGLILAVGISIGVMIAQFAATGAKIGSPEGNTVIAATLAAIFVTVLFFVLSLTIIGALIVGLLSLIDLILFIAGVDFSIAGWLTDLITEFIYAYEPIVDADVDAAPLDMTLDFPDRGMRADTSLSFATTMTTALTMTDPNAVASGYVGTQFYLEEDIDDTRFAYELSNFARDLSDAEVQDSPSSWNPVVDRPYSVFYDLFKGSKSDDVSVSGVSVPVGINSVPTFYLNNGYSIPVYECWNPALVVPVCYTETLKGTDSIDYGASLYYDIFPQTVDEFVALDWGGSTAFPPAADFDGDGQPASGLDPDDTNWDVDGDGLSDGFELELRGLSREDGGFPISYQSADTDADGLCDADELIIGTDPTDRDSDDDGLWDSEEVWHQDCATGNWSGGWVFTYGLAADTSDGLDHTVRIFSSPVSYDGDGDGFNDQLEKVLHEADPAGFPFHPAVYNDSPGGLYPELSEDDNVVAPGQTVVYTLTVRNNFPDPYWVFGSVTTTLPAVVGGGVFNDVTYDPDGTGLEPAITDSVFNLFPANTAAMVLDLQVDASSGSTSEIITNELRSQLNRNGDISYDWIVNNFNLNRQSLASGFHPWTVALAHVPENTGWGTPYVAAVLEVDDPADPFIWEVVLYELDETVALRRVLATFVMEDTLFGSHGTPTIDVVCAADGDCLVLYNYFDEIPDDPTDGMHVGGVQVDPNGIIAGTDFYLGVAGDTDDDYGGDLLWPAAASDGSRFWIAYTSESDLIGSTDRTKVILARRVFDNGTVGAVGRVDQNDTALSPLIESYVDMAWMGNDQLILTWSTPDDDYNDVHKAIIDDSAMLVPNSYADVTSFGDTPRIAYEPSIDKGILVFREREPQIDNENYDDYAIRAFFVNSGDIASGFRPAGGASPDDIVHSPAVAYDYYNEGWVIGWIGDKAGASTLYYSAYNNNDSLSRISKEAIQLTGIEPPTGLSFACTPTPPVLELTDCRVAGAEGEVDGGGGELFWQKAIIELDSPFYGPYDNEADLELVVDDDEPDSSFINLPGYVRPDEIVIIGGEATDPTSNVVQVEISVDGGPYDVAAEGAKAASWAYAWDTLSAEGQRTLRVRATDAADNVQSAPTAATVLVDGTPPQVTFDVAPDQLLAPVELLPGEWYLPLSGQVVDPDVGAFAGSGVASLELSVSPAGTTGGAWQSVTWDSNGAWQIDYPLASPVSLANANALTGLYTIRVRTADNLGNAFATAQAAGIDRESGNSVTNLKVDNTPPASTLDVIGGVPVTFTTVVTHHPVIFNGTLTYTVPTPSLISDTVTLAGVADDSADIASGIAAVELSYTPLDFLTSPFDGTAVGTQLWNDTATSPISPTTSTWSDTVPTGLEGFFNIDVRATDVVSNVDEAEIDWTKWSGEIDTNSPRVTANLSYAGWASTARTEYDVTVEDVNLVEAGFAFDVCLPPGSSLTDQNRGYLDTAWANAFLPAQRLIALNLACIEPGLITELFRVQGCDAFGRCTGRDFAPDFNLYIADSNRVLTRTNSLGGSAETAAVLNEMNRPTFAIDSGTLTYVAHNDTPAAAIRQSNLDGSGDTLLARLMPGSGSADEAQVIAAGLVVNDDYGASLSISADGNTMAVVDDDVFSQIAGRTAEVYVFERSATGWIEVATLLWELDDSATIAFLSSSRSVAVNEDGSTIVVGNPFQDVNGTSNAGSATIYERSGASWDTGFNPNPVARLYASNASANLNLGSSVAISGTTIVAAPFAGDTIYVFEEPGGGWASAVEDASIILPTSNVDHRVAVQGDRIAAVHNGGAYVYARNGLSWTLEGTLTGATGPAVAIDDGIVIAGNDLFTFDGSTWVYEATLPAAADSAALSGGVAVLGDESAREANVFVRLAGAWRHELRLTPSDGAAAGLFGAATTIVGDAVAVGAPDGGGFDVGAVYLYRVGLDGTLTPPPLSEYDGGRFSSALAIDGDTMVIGAPQAEDPSNATLTGAAFVYERRENVWYLQQTLFPNVGNDGDTFGAAVDVDGDHIIVGSPTALNSFNAQVGAVYIYEWNGSSWSFAHRFGNIRSDNGFFGRTVGIDGTAAVVGAPFNDGNKGQGVVYAFDGANWDYAATLSTTDAQNGATDNFGWDVAVDGDTIVVSPLAIEEVFVYTRPASGWTSTLEDATLREVGESFGAVAVSGSTVAALGNALHLFAEPAGGWSGTRSPVQTLTPPDQLGVALEGDKIVVGGVDAAHVYTRDVDGVWSAPAPITVTSPIAVQFGRPVAIDGETLVAGAIQSSGATGTAFVFDSVSVAAVDGDENTVTWAERNGANSELVAHTVGAPMWQQQTLVAAATSVAYADVVLSDGGTAVFFSEYDTAAPGQGRIRRVDLPDGGNAATIVGTGARPHSVALNEFDQRLYWTTDVGGELYQANLDGSQASVLYSGLISPTAVALLSAESAVYWVADTGSATVFRGDLAASTPAPIITVTASIAEIAADQNYLPVANDQDVVTAINDSIQFTLDAYDPDDDPLTYAAVALPTHGSLSGTPPTQIYAPDDDFIGTDTFTYTVADGRGGTAQATVTFYVGVSLAPTARATATITEGTNLSLNIQSLDDYTPPARDSIIFTPRDGAVFTDGGPITISGAAYAADGLNRVRVRANGDLIYSLTITDAVTETTWTTSWTPPADGVYALESRARDVNNVVESEVDQIDVIVDTAPPSVSIDSSSINLDDIIAGPLVEVTGTASDAAGVSRVEFRYETPGLGDGPWRLAEYDSTTGAWRYAFSLGTLVDDVAVFVTVRATDFAGNVAEIGDALAVDLRPPTAVALGVAYDDGGLIPLAAGDLVPLAAPTLVLTWTESSDGAFFVGYRAGWSTSVDPADPWLDEASYSGADTHQYVAAEAQALFAHLELTDLNDNSRVQTVGPIYVDGPLTPDLVGDLDFVSWRGSGHTLLSADYEIRRQTSPNGALHQPQRFYTSWDATQLRLTWEGANWNTHGDLFIYLDSAAGGGTATFDPWASTSPTLTLPAAVAADYLIWVQDSLTATLLAWSAGAWTTIDTLTPDQYRFTAPRGVPTADVLLPFAMVGITDPTAEGLKLVAFATVEASLRTWAAAPDHNPLNSARVVDASAEAYTTNGYTLTHYFEWAALGAGVHPNGGTVAGSDLHADIALSPNGVAVGYLASDWLDLLTPGVPLDADLNGTLDRPLPIPAELAPVGDGSSVQYAIQVVNRGDVAADDVQVTWTATGPLLLDDAGPAVLGTILPGETMTVTIDGTVDTTLSGDAVELDVTVSDSRLGTFDWLWAHNVVDREAPVDVGVTLPLSYVVPLTNTIAGVVTDTAAVPQIDLQIRTLPDNTVVNLGCVDSSPTDGTWACPYDFGTLAGTTAVEVRARATDIFGQTSAWSLWRLLSVDDTPPVLALDASVDLLLQDGYLSADENIWRGTLTDNAPRDVTVCGPEACTLSSAADGTWANALALPSADGITTTVIITGRDASLNLSLPLSRTFLVDTVPPQLTIDTRETSVPISDTVDIIAGTYSDGGGIAELYVRLQGPAGSQWTAAKRTDTAWRFAPELTALGAHTITIQAFDQAGNATNAGPFYFTVVDGPSAVGLQMVAARLATGWLWPMALGLLLVGAWLWRRRRLYAAQRGATVSR